MPHINSSTRWCRTPPTQVWFGAGANNCTAPIAHALEERFPEIVATEPETLAHHFTEAGLWERATLYWQRAGELALRRSAVGEAVDAFFERIASFGDGGSLARGRPTRA